LLKVQGTGIGTVTTSIENVFQERSFDLHPIRQ